MDFLLVCTYAENGEIVVAMTEDNEVTLKTFYKENDIFWYRYDSGDVISSEINGYLCLGVYRIQTRTITKEIFTNKEIIS